MINKSYQFNQLPLRVEQNAVIKVNVEDSSDRSAIGAHYYQVDAVDNGQIIGHELTNISDYARKNGADSFEVVG